MTYFTYIFINIYHIVSNITCFTPCKFIKTIGNISISLLCLKKNELSTVLEEQTESKNIDLKKKYITTHKRTFKYLHNVNTHNKYVDDDCDWGWFVAIDNCDVYGK